MIYLDIAKPFSATVNPQVLKQAARKTLEHEPGSATASLTLVIDGEERIRQLNAEFLRIDEPTDVLSFPADYIDPDTQQRYLGDVVIAYPQAEAQARSAGHTLEAELQLLTVHGVLHLLGYDHTEDKDREAMWGVQARILNQLGSTVTTPPG